MSDKTVPKFAKDSFIAEMRNKTAWCQRQIDIRVTDASRERYKQYVKSADSLVYANIASLLASMTPEQIEMVETVIDAIRRGERIEVEHVKSKQ